MSSRISTFALGVLTCIVAGAPVEMLLGQAGASEECLASPKKESPPGRHWFYRVDRSNKRHCWYLGDARGTVSSSAKSRPSPRAALLAKLRRENPLPVRPTDARAELTQGRAENTLRAEDAQLTAATVWNRPVEPQDARRDLPNRVSAEDAQSKIAARWPEASFAVASAKPEADAHTTTDPVPSTSPAPMDTAGAPVVSRAEAQPVKRSKSLYSLFWAICGACVLVAFAGSVAYVAIRAQERVASNEYPVEPFEIAGLNARLDPAASMSARPPTPHHHGLTDVPRQFRTARRLVT